jgi:hypothetical protein
MKSLQGHGHGGLTSEDDYRTVTPTGVEQVMCAFRRHFLATEATQRPIGALQAIENSLPMKNCSMETRPRSRILPPRHPFSCTCMFKSPEDLRSIIFWRVLIPRSIPGPLQATT